MARIFISYSRVDEDFARCLADDLLRLGADVWIDVDDIRAGLSWADSIQEGLDACDVMIVVIAPESMASKNVADEWQYYVEERRPVVPVYLRRARVHYQLRRLQYVDFLNQDYDTAFTQLHSELRRKGVRLAPISVRDEIVDIPAQAPLPDRDGGGIPRAYWGAGAVIAALIVTAIILGLSGVFNGGDDNGGGDDPGGTQAGIAGSATHLPETQAWLDYLATVQNLPTATLTPTITLTPSDTPDATGTYDAARTRIAQTATAQQPTSAPAPATPTPLETALERARDFSGGNDDWQPVSETFDGVEMVLVPAGCFMMGSENGDSDEQPVHEVCFDEPFWIDRTEVTNAQYGSSGRWSGDDRPRENVTWFQARDFCASRGARLPTEAEWEYAARGPDARVYPWGDVWNANNAVYYENSGSETADVGSKPGGASWVGALDMSGNVWEWVSSINSDYPYDENDGREDAEDTSSARVLRGGGFGLNPHALRGADRYGYLPTNRGDGVGFRCARVPHLES